MPGADFDAFVAGARLAHAWLPDALLHRYARAYGTRLERVVGDARSLRDLGEQILPGLYEREVDYLRREEWAVTAEDILCRRSKLALHVPDGSAGRLDDWLAGHPVA
jgi:glycerol-3-phosphate dehydrogenase